MMSTTRLRYLAVTSIERIEQGTVLLYDDGTLALSVEPHMKSFYMSGRYQVEISAATRLLEQMVAAFQGRGMAASIEYQEEDEKGAVVSPCFVVATG